MISYESLFFALVSNSGDKSNTFLLNANKKAILFLFSCLKYMKRTLKRCREVLPTLVPGS